MNDKSPHGDNKAVTTKDEEQKPPTYTQNPIPYTHTPTYNKYMTAKNKDYINPEHPREHITGI
jgi:hypothetical protein